GRMPQVPGALPSFTPGKVLATGLDGLQGLHRVGEGLDTDHFQFTVGGGLGDLGTTFRRHEEVLRPGTLGTDHLLRNTAGLADLARGGDGPRTGDLRAPADALLAEPVHDPEREHQSRARATDVADADVHVDGEVGVVGDEDPHHGGALVTLLAGDLDLDGLTVPVQEQLHRVAGVAVSHHLHDRRAADLAFLSTTGVHRHFLPVHGQDHI